MPNPNFLFIAHDGIVIFQPSLTPEGNSGFQLPTILGGFG